MLVSIEKTIQDSTVGIVVTLEVFFLYWQMHMSRSLICQLIYKLNDVLRVEDMTMKTIVKSTLKPVEAPLKFYCIAGTGSIIVWCCIPFMLVSRKECFFYEDYRLPMVLSKQPFSTEIFLLGNFLACVASTYMFIKKVALDVYMINLVLLITAQYRYISVKLAMILQKDSLQDHHNKYENKNYFLIEKEMRLLCQHHRAVVQ
ncbi:uncharacterized protein LOC109861915 [Pseudomyrmex gracilis]|uniref:uncharacterized protein LOC109861915 n=1 Tax=Pseudomyrmex gracilis TaxID=219809 RepID=UPI000994F537|nr:uncharacterized protein LOC109861915 [Pseudomyrmex gracilis]